MTTSHTVARYLERIGLTEPPPIDLDGLTALQAAHLSTVPFENLDVYGRYGVRTDTDWSVAKIVNRHRGGWCFENNGAFGWLLAELGFDVSYMGAYILTDSDHEAHMSHLCLIVELERSYLTDVGFGDSFIRPVPIGGDAIDDGNAIYTVEIDDPWCTLIQKNSNVLDISPNGRPLYRFERIPRSLSEFDGESVRMQEESHFTEKPFATRLMNGGPDRVTLLQDRIKFRRNGEWTEEPVDPDQWDETYRAWF